MKEKMKRIEEYTKAMILDRLLDPDSENEIYDEIWGAGMKV